MKSNKELPKCIALDSFSLPYHCFFVVIGLFNSVSTFTLISYIVYKVKQKIGYSLLRKTAFSSILLVMNTKTFLKTIGSKIRAVRKSRKMSQERLAELSGLHPTYVSDIENGKVNSSIYSFYAIANALNIPCSDILSVPTAKTDKGIEAELAEMLSLFRSLDKKKQTIFLSAAKGLISGIDKT